MAKAKSPKTRAKKTRKELTEEARAIAKQVVWDDGEGIMFDTNRATMTHLTFVFELAGVEGSLLTREDRLQLVERIREVIVVAAVRLARGRRSPFGTGA